MMSDKFGGFGETKVSTEEIQQISDQVKPEVEKKTNKKYVVFTATKYRSQIVSGTNYLIKVDVGEGHYIHLKVYQSLSGEIKLSGVQEGHSKDDPIEPFGCDGTA